MDGAGRAGGGSLIIWKLVFLMSSLVRTLYVQRAGVSMKGG